MFGNKIVNMCNKNIPRCCLIIQTERSIQQIFACLTVIIVKLHTFGEKIDLEPQAQADNVWELEIYLISSELIIYFYRTIAHKSNKWLGRA